MISEDPIVFESVKRDLEWEQQVVDYLLSLSLRKVRDNNFLPTEQKQEEDTIVVYSLVNWLNRNSENLRTFGFVLESADNQREYFTGKIELKTKCDRKE